MTKLVVHGATLRCDQGAAPAALAISPPHGAKAESKALAVVTDFVPSQNIPPFGMCRTLQNPQVQAATTAAQGVLTPVPCLPVTGTPWSGGPTDAKLRGQVILTKSHTCACKWGGQISVADSATQHVGHG